MFTEQDFFSGRYNFFFGKIEYFDIKHTQSGCMLNGRPWRVITISDFYNDGYSIIMFTNSTAHVQRKETGIRGMLFIAS